MPTMIPRAKIVHEMDGRVRIKISGRTRDKKDYFSRVQTRLKTQFGLDDVLVSPLTGSIVLLKKGGAMDLDSVKAWALKEGLFDMGPVTGSGNLVGSCSRTIVQQVDGTIRKISGNRLDMGSSVFLVLIIHALRELAVGNLKTPSWFSALWFASNIYSKNFSGAPEEKGYDQCGSGDGGD